MATTSTSSQMTPHPDLSLDTLSHSEGTGLLPRVHRDRADPARVVLLAKGCNTTSTTSIRERALCTEIVGVTAGETTP